MTLLVRDEADIVRENIEYHLARGVDHIIATDNASSDGTSEILEEFERAGCLSLFREPSNDYLQEEWVNRMIEIVRERYPGAWIINNDADEFWRPPDREGGSPGNLKIELANAKTPSVICYRHNMITSVENLGRGHWSEALVWRARKPIDWPREVNIREHPLAYPYFLYNLPHKVLVNMKGLIRVQKGSHTASHENGASPAHSTIQIYHYPIRSRIEFEKSVERIADALRRNPPPGNTSAKYIRWGNMLVKHGAIDAVLKDALPTRTQLLKLRLLRGVEHDARLLSDLSRC